MNLPSDDHAGEGLSAPISVSRVNLLPSKFDSHKSQGKPCADARVTQHVKKNSIAHEFSSRGASNDTPGNFFLGGPDAVNKIDCESGEKRAPYSAEKLVVSTINFALLPFKSATQSDEAYVCCSNL